MSPKKCTYAEGVSKKIRSIIKNFDPWKEGLGIESCFGTRYEKFQLCFLKTSPCNVKVLLYSVP